MLQVFSYRILTRVCSAVFQSLALFVIARALGPVDFGQYVLGISLGSFLTAVLGFGIANRALRLALEPEADAMSRAMTAVALLSAVANGAVTAASTILLFGVKPFIGAAAAAVVLADHFVGAMQAILAGRQQPYASANLLLAHRAVSASAVFLAYIFDAAVLQAYAASSAGLMVVYIALFIRKAPWRVLEKVVTGAAGYWATAIAGASANLDTVVVRVSTGITATGIYSAATRLVSPLNIALSSLLSVVIPFAASERDAYRRHRLFRRSLRYALPLSIILALSSPVIANVAIVALGPEYEQSRYIIMAVVVGVALSSISQVIQAELLTAGKAVYVAVSIGIGTLSGLGMLAGAGHFWGAEGLIVGPIATQAVILFSLLFAHRSVRFL